MAEPAFYRCGACLRAWQRTEWKTRLNRPPICPHCGSSDQTMLVRLAPKKRTKTQIGELKSTQRLLGLRGSGPFADLCANCGEEGHFAAICPDESTDRGR